MMIIKQLFATGVLNGSNNSLSYNYEERQLHMWCISKSILVDFTCTDIAQKTSILIIYSNYISSPFSGCFSV